MDNVAIIAIISTVISGIIVSIFTWQLDKMSKREDKRDDYLKQLELSIKSLERSDRECSHKIERIHDLLLRRSENAQLKHAILMDTIERIEDQLDRTTDYVKTRHKASTVNPLETMTDNTGLL